MPTQKTSASAQTTAIRDLSKPFSGYATYLGRYWNATFEQWAESRYGEELKGQVDLILTSPPFPLNRKKKYGNLQGAAYLEWLRELAPQFRKLLSRRGSLVIEIGNAWNPGEPTMSTLPIEALLAFKVAGDFHLCQEFVCHNPARLPSPVEYVNKKRNRVKDSWTRVWWLSKTTTPKANNKNVLLPYSPAMRDLLKRQKFNAGARPSQHAVSPTAFLKNNGGSIPASCLTSDVLEHFGSLLIASNTKSVGDSYLEWCADNEHLPHPARMQAALARFFVSFLTSEGDFIFDPFGGSNTTGWVAQSLNRRWGTVEAKATYTAASKARFQDRRAR